MPPVSESAGTGTENPLITTAGVSALHPTGIRRVDLGGVLASEGDSSREARATHERRPRRYQLTFENSGESSGRDLKLCREAWAVTRQGAGVTRWRHPVDDAAPPVEPADAILTAPRWRPTEPMAADRSSGGNVVGFTFVLEEVGDAAARANGATEDQGGGGAGGIGGGSDGGGVGGGGVGMGTPPDGGDDGDGGSDGE